LKYLLIILLLLSPVLAYADSEGPNSPSISANEEDGWTNPDSIFSDDDKYAVKSDEYPHWLGGYGFSFSIPEIESLDSIKIDGRGYGDGKDEGSYDIDVVWSPAVPEFAFEGEPATCRLNQDSEGDFSHTFTENLPDWEMVNEETFGVLIRRNSEEYSDGIYIDHVTITVYYTPTMSQTITAIDTNYTSIEVKDNYTFTGGCTCDSSYFQITDDDWSTFDTTKITDPTDPDTTLFSGLDGETEYKIRVLSYGCETDTSNILTITTLGIDHSLAFYDSTCQSLSVYNNYSNVTSPDTLWFIIDDDDNIASPLEIDTTASPTDPDSTVFTSLEGSTQYWVWSLVAKDGYRDTSSSINRYTKAPPDSTPDSLMITTWYTEKYDASGYGYSNPDPDDSSQGPVTLAPYFSWRIGEQDSVWARRIQVVTDSTDTTTAIWSDTIAAFADNDTLNEGERTPKIQFPDTVDRRLKPGRQYFYRVKNYSGADTTASPWSGWMTFYGLALSQWWNEDYLCRKTINFDTSHGALDSYVPLKLSTQTGNGLEVTDEAARDCMPDIVYNPNDGYKYVVWSAKTSQYNSGKVGSYGYFISKYNSDMDTLTTPVLLGKYRSEAHYYPMISITDSTLAVLTGGHNNHDMWSYLCDSLKADSGFILTEFIGGGADTATGTVGDSALINTTVTWATNELDGFYVRIRPEGGAEEKEILANNNCTLYVASAWLDPPEAGDNYEIYSIVSGTQYSTYPMPVTIGDSAYYFFREDGSGSGGDSTGTVDGQSQSETTLQDESKNWVVDCFKGWKILNVTKSETRTVASNTASIITIDGTWTTPENDDSYKIYTPHHGFWCYVRFDPHANIASAYSDKYYVINYNDAPAWSGGHDPCIYASAFHNNQNDNRYVHVGATFWDYYSTAPPADSQGGGANTYLRCQVDNGVLKTWTKANGDTVGYAFTDKLNHTDSTINKTACELLDTCAGVHDSLFIGAGNQYGIVADTNNVPYVVWTKFRENNYEPCALYFGRYYDGAWDIDSLTEGTSDSLINFRLGGAIILDGSGLYVLGEIWESGTGEINSWQTNLNYATLTWDSEMITRNSGHGSGRIKSLPLTYPGVNRTVIYLRDNMIYILEIKSWPYMQPDGDDGRLVIGVINDTGIVETYYDRPRLPVHTWGSKATDIEFTSLSAIAEDSICSENLSMEFYFKNRVATDPPNTKTHLTTGIYKIYDGMESYTADSGLGKATNWTVNVGADTVRSYVTGWFSPLWEGKQYVQATGYTDAKYTNGSFVLGPKTLVGVNLKLGTGYGKIYLELFDDHSRCYKLGAGYVDGSNRGLLYDDNTGSGWELSDSILYPSAYNKVEIRIGGVAMINTAYPIYGYINDMLIFSSTEADTLETGGVTAGGHTDWLVNVDGNWAADSLNGKYIKIFSGTYEDSIRQITDTKPDTIYFSAFPGEILTGITYGIWDSTIGYYYDDPQDSIKIRTDTTGEQTCLHSFDGLYLRKTYDGYLNADSISLETSATARLRQSYYNIMIIGGD